MITAIVFFTLTTLIIGYVCYLYYNYLQQESYWRKQGASITKQFVHPVFAAVLPFGSTLFEYTNVRQMLFNVLNARDGKVHVVLFGARAVIFIGDPKFGKLMASSSVFQKRMRFTDSLNDLFGDNVFSTGDEEIWRRHRTLLNVSFVPKVVSEAVFGETVPVMNQWIANHSQQVHVVDLEKETANITMDIIGRAGFGYNFGAVEGKGENPMYADTNRLIKSTSWLPFLPKLIKTYVRVGPIQAVYKSVDNFRVTIRDIIEHKKQDADLARKDILSSLLSGTSESQESLEPLTEKELISNSFIMLIAGHETTARSLYFTLYLLSKHQDIQTKLRDTLRDLLLDKSNTIRELTETDIEHPALDYLKQVINEAMRLLPVAAGTVRMTRKFLQFDEFAIPKGSYVFYQWMQNQKDSEFWGSDSEEFKPERWTADLNEKLRRNPFQYTPFGIGKRSCIGKLFAEIEMIIVLVKLLSNFRVSLADDRQVLSVVMNVTLQPKEQIHFKFEHINL